MALNDAERLHMVSMALMRHSVITKGGEPISPGELIADGLQLDINPNADRYDVDEDGYITNYQIKDHEQDIGGYSLVIGRKAAWDIVGTDKFVVTDDENIYHYPGASNTRTFLVSRKEHDDCELTYKIKLSGAGTMFGAVLFRGTALSTSSYNGYRFALQASSFQLSTYTNGTGAVLASKSMSTALDTWYKVRIYANGTNLKAKIWLASGSEPSAWDIEETDATYSSGAIMVYGVNSNVYAYFGELYAAALNGTTISGLAKIVQDTTLNGKKRIYAESEFAAEYYPFGLLNTMPRTVFMLYRVRDDGYRNNYNFLKEVGTSLSFGVIGKDAATSDGKNVISIFGKAGDTAYSAVQYDISISRNDGFELVCATAEDNTTGISGYSYGVKEITSRSNQWTEILRTRMAIQPGAEFVRLLYYNRVLSDDELGKVHQYLAYTYGKNLYLTSDYLRL